MGENSLSSHGPVSSVNRLVRTRMLGGVGRGRERLPPYPIRHFLYFFIKFLQMNAQIQIPIFLHSNYILLKICPIGMAFRENHRFYLFPQIGEMAF